jgi:serine/threonine protein kinase
MVLWIYVVCQECIKREMSKMCVIATICSAIFPGVRSLANEEFGTVESGKAITTLAAAQPQQRTDRDYEKAGRRGPGSAVQSLDRKIEAPRPGPWVFPQADNLKEPCWDSGVRQSLKIKSYRGRIEGTDNDWWLPNKIRSPLKLNRLTSQVLKTHLRNASYQAGQVWTEGLVFLSATTDVGVRGPARNDRVHTRKSILAALQDEALIERLSQGRARTSSSLAERELLELFTGAQGGPRPVRRVREYEVVETLDHHDTFTEVLGRNTLSSAERVLRIYSIPPLATDAQRDRVTERARWEAQVLGRLGRSEGVLTADPPFSEEAGIVLPLEYFKGITLTTWVERYGPDARGKERADLRARTDLWMRIAATIEEVHRQGVVHRLLRPDIVLVEDRQDPTQIRVTGLEGSVPLSTGATVSECTGVTAVDDGSERRSAGRNSSSTRHQSAGPVWALQITPAAASPGQHKKIVFDYSYAFVVTVRPFHNYVMSSIQPRSPQTDTALSYKREGMRIVYDVLDLRTFSEREAFLQAATKVVPCFTDFLTEPIDEGVVYFVIEQLWLPGPFPVLSERSFATTDSGAGGSDVRFLLTKGPIATRFRRFLDLQAALTGWAEKYNIVSDWALREAFNALTIPIDSGPPQERFCLALARMKEFYIQYHTSSLLTRPPNGERVLGTPTKWNPYLESEAQHKRRWEACIHESLARARQIRDESILETKAQFVVTGEKPLARKRKRGNVLPGLRYEWAALKQCSGRGTCKIE